MMDRAGRGGAADIVQALGTLLPRTSHLLQRQQPSDLHQYQYSQQTDPLPSQPAPHKSDLAPHESDLGHATPTSRSPPDHAPHKISAPPRSPGFRAPAPARTPVLPHTSSLTASTTPSGQLRHSCQSAGSTAVRSPLNRPHNPTSSTRASRLRQEQARLAAARQRCESLPYRQRVAALRVLAQQEALMHQTPAARHHRRARTQKTRRSDQLARMWRGECKLCT